MQSAILNLYGDVAQLGEPAQHNTGPVRTANCTNKSSKNIQNNQTWAYSSAGRAYGSHPYGPPSPARFFLPIFCPVFRTIPSKLNISKIRFS